MKDAVKHSKSFYAFNGINIDNTETKVFEVNGTITKLVNDLTTKIKDRKLNSVIENPTRTAQIYFSHKLINVTHEDFIFLFQIFFFRIKFLICILYLMVNHILFRILNGFVIQLIIYSILTHGVIEQGDIFLNNLNKLLERRFICYQKVI